MVDHFWLVAATGFFVGALLASFIEYAVHILMHWRYVLGKVHTRHHKHGEGDGVFWEWLYYIAGAAPAAAGIVALGIYFGYEPIAFGLAAGSLTYGSFAAYAHQLHHDRPELVFWMPMPVHYIHHHHQQWRANFGIGVDIWDRLFGTYERLEFRPERERGSLLNFLRIKWV